MANLAGKYLDCRIDGIDTRNDTRRCVCTGILHGHASQPKPKKSVMHRGYENERGESTGTTATTTTTITITIAPVYTLFWPPLRPFDAYPGIPVLRCSDRVQCESWRSPPISSFRNVDRLFNIWEPLARTPADVIRSKAENWIFLSFLPSFLPLSRLSRSFAYLDKLLSFTRPSSYLRVCSKFLFRLRAFSLLYQLCGQVRRSSSL